MEGVRCPGALSAALPLLLWWAALEGDSRILWLWHQGRNGDGVVGPGVMQIDGVRNCGCTCYRPYAGRSGGGSA